MVTDSGGQAPEPPPALVRAFLDASRDALNFLVGQPGFQSAVTVERASNDAMVPVALDAVTGPFWARRTFLTSRLTGTFTYGDRELGINLIVGLLPSTRWLLLSKRGVGPYGLWEWVAALGSPLRLNRPHSAAGRREGRARAVGTPERSGTRGGRLPSRRLSPSGFAARPT